MKEEKPKASAEDSKKGGMLRWILILGWAAIGVGLGVYVGWGTAIMYGVVSWFVRAWASAPVRKRNRYAAFLDMEREKAHPPIRPMPPRPPVVRDFQAEIRNGVALADKEAGESQFPISPLHAAASRNNPDVVVALIKRGDDISAVNHIGWTPLHYAKYYGAMDVYAELVKNGADEDAESARGETPKTLRNRREIVAPFHALPDEEKMPPPPVHAASGYPVPDDWRRRRPTRW